MSSLSEIEEDDLSKRLVPFSQVGSLTPFWYDDMIWVRVPGYRTFCTCIINGKQEFIPDDALVEIAKD